MMPVVEAMQLKNRVKNERILFVSEQVDYLNDLREQRFYYENRESQRWHEEVMKEHNWSVVCSGRQPLSERYTPEVPQGVWVYQSLFV